MAKQLNLLLNGRAFGVSPVKVERKKLYGYTEVRGIDTNSGKTCRQAGLDGNGVTIVPKGATKIGMVCEDGSWMEKSELQACHADGSVAERIASSFDVPINIYERATAEDLLDIIVTSVYQLTGEANAELAQTLGNDIWSFNFNYSAGYTSSRAFLLSNGMDCFIITGDKADFEMISLEEQGVLDEEDDEMTSEDDELDFSLF